MATLALIDQMGWAIISPGVSWTGLHAHAPMPQVECPVVDTRGVEREQVIALLRRELDAHAPASLDHLLDGLRALGCLVQEDIP